MSETINFFKKSVLGFIRFLFLHIINIVQGLQKAKDGIPFKERCIDVFSVIQKTGVLFLLNVLAFIVFTLLPQGKDVIFIISEEVGVENRYGNLIWLLIGVSFWSIISEFACRYSVYVSDNSGKSVSEERVKWKKAVQKLVAELSLIAPFFILLFAFLINYLADDSLKESARKLGFGIPAICLYLLLNIIVWVYFENKPDSHARPENSEDDPNSFREKFKIAMRKKILLPNRELEWCNKLYGIYNDHVFQIRKPENFRGNEEKDFFEFCDNFLKLSEEERNRFPKDKNKVFEYSRVPADFQFKEFTVDEGISTDLSLEERLRAEKESKGGTYRWVFRIPNHFYKHLHKQVAFVCGISLSLFLLVTFMKLEWYDNIGAPGLVVLAFACWSGMYVGILFLDYSIFRSYVEKTLWKRILGNIPLRASLFIWLIIISFTNDDHKIRYNNVQATDNRAELKEHFEAWLKNYIKDSSNLYIENDTCFFPVGFVCAEGGASRTGAYTAMMLSCLQDSILYQKKVDLKKSIYCYSGVSGGSLGLGFFNAISYYNKRGEMSDDTLSNLTKIFFSKDFLAPVLGKMFYGEILNLFLPSTVDRFDRAIAIEEIWESSYESILYSNQQNYFSADCRSIFNKSEIKPALFINTTEVETGRQCYLSNVKTIETGFLDKEHDLMNYKIRAGINLSTMINFSTRFPLISPAGCLEENSGKQYHYVDGGYYENSGAGTMIEVYRKLLPIIDNLAKKYKVRIKPYAIMLRFGADREAAKEAMNYGNGITEIVSALYNVRGGRTEFSVNRFKQLIEERNKNGFISLCLEQSSNDVPMNWVLSEKSLENIKKDIMKKWHYKEKNDLKYLYTNFLKCSNKSAQSGRLGNDTITFTVDTLKLLLKFHTGQ